MTFPGESLVLDYANPISGSITAWGDPMRYRAGSDTLTSGTSFIAGFYDYRVVDDYPGEPVAASVVLVLGAATSGTMRVSYGVDEDFGLDNPALVTQDLGTHAVTGASTLVLPVTLDLSGLLAFDHEQIAFVEILSGSVEVVQIKFRLWPPSGISGAWVPGPDVTVERGVQVLAGNPSSTGNGASTSSMSDAYSLAVASWNALGDLTVAGRAVAVNGSVSYSLNTEGHEDFSVMLDGPRLLHVQANDVGEVVAFTDAGQIAHPDEVWGEPAAVVRGADGEPVTYEFLSWTRALETEQSAGVRTPPGDLIPSVTPQLVNIEAGADRPATYTSSGTTYATRPTAPPASGTTITPPTTETSVDPLVLPLALPSSPKVLLTVASYSWYSQALENLYVDEGNVYYDSGMTLQVTVPTDLYALLSVPAYLIWDPDAVVDIPMRIRQRGDGLGMGSSRVRGTQSRQRSTRVRGHY